MNLLAIRQLMSAHYHFPSSDSYLVAFYSASANLRKFGSESLESES